MFARILVPLDGSRLAEAALPAASALRLAFGSSITLIHVLESDAPKDTHGERHLRDGQEAEAYLADTASRYFPDGAGIQHHVHTGGISDVSESLTEHFLELGQDLIIMCVHGRGGILRMVTGNIAQRILGRHIVPVLLVRAGIGGPIAPTFRRFLVALDGKPDHEQGLAIAEELAHKTGAHILLLTVVPTRGTLMGERGATGLLLPRATQELLSQTEASAARYLEEQASKLSLAGITVETAVRRGYPPGQIASLARAASADLIVLGTHGRAGTQAFWAGSTAHRLVGRTHTPLLLIPTVRSPS